MSMAAIVLGTSAVIVVGFLGYVASQPSAFRIERSLDIQADPQALFEKVNNLHEFNRWNPFALADQTTKIEYQGPVAGVSSSYNWEGAKSGSGTMTVVESSSPTRIVMRLQFQKPYVADNTATFSFSRNGGATRVTWAMTGRYGFLHKLFGTVFNMDKMVGGEFAKGLASLKKQTEPGRSV